MTTRLTPREELLHRMRCNLVSVARDWKSGSRAARKNARPLSEVIGGSLNPEWVEWLMGWPIGWTALEHSETGRYPEWLVSHGVF